MGAEMAGPNVRERDVSVALSVGNASASTGRRLRNTERRLEDDEVVICDANISVPDATQAQSMQTTLTELTPLQIEGIVFHQLESAGFDDDVIYSLNVSSGISAEITLPPSPPPTPSGQAS